MVDRMLVPLDGSDNANLALDVGADMATKLGATLKILHVGVRQPVAHMDLYKAAERSFGEAEKKGGWTSDHKDWPRHLQVLEHMGRMILDEGARRAKSRGVSVIETEIDWGDEGERILHHAKHPAVDMIVMGSRGASPLQGLFLGSVSHKVFHLAPCTCVTVHAAKGQSGLEGLKEIAVPFDGSSHALRALDLASGLAQTFDARLTLLHVLERGWSREQWLDVLGPDSLDPETRRRLDERGTILPLAFAADVIPDEVLRTLAQALLRDARTVAMEKGVQQVETKLLAGRAADSILNAVKEIDADLIVMGMRGLGEVAGMLVGSLSYKLNHLAPCTCVCVR